MTTRTHTETTPTAGRPQLHASWLELHRGFMVERTGAMWIARDPFTGTVMVEASGMVGRYVSADMARAAIDRKISAGRGWPRKICRNMQLYS